MGRLVSAKSAHWALGTPRTLYFDKRGRKGILRVDRETFKVKFEPHGDTNADMDWSEAQRDKLVVPLEEGVWFDFGRIYATTHITTMGTSFPLGNTHPGKKSAEYAQARMLWKGEAIWLTVSIQRPHHVWTNQHLTPENAVRPHVKFWLEIMGRRGEPLRQGRPPKATWEGLSYPHLPMGKTARHPTRMGHKWRGDTFETIPHDLLPYAMGWAEEILFPVSSERLIIALRNGKPVSGYTSLGGVGGARVRYEQLGRKLDLPVTVAAAPPKFASGLSMTAKQLEEWKKAQVDRARLRSQQSRSLRQGMKAERRALEREWGSAIRGGGLDKGSVAAAKKKAKENPSSWYLGGSKPGILGTTYYYLNRHKPYTLFFTVRPPREEKFPTHLHGRKPRKTRVTLYRLTPFAGQRLYLHPPGKLTEEEWWRGLDPSKPLRYQATKSPIHSKVHADKDFYHSGHLSSLKYQVLDWADSVIFTPAERLGLV